MAPQPSAPTANPSADGGRDVESDADLAARLVTEAGELAARMRTEGLSGERKTSVSDVVTEADRAAEAHVLHTLRGCRPQDGVIGEEGTDVASRSGRTWVVDPVDGTYNFLSGLGYWCSAIALRDADGPILGAIYVPAEGAIWIGGPDLPTTRNGAPVARLAEVPLAESSLATYLHPTRMTDPNALESFLAMATGAATVRMFGSGSCDLANVAGGRLGAWAMSSAPAWDWLPGAAIVQGAGGVTDVVDHRGFRWHLAGNGTVVAELRARLTSADGPQLTASW